MLLSDFNQYLTAAAGALLLDCCFSKRWVALMLRARPFADKQSMLAKATAIWRDLAAEDYLEAFRGHPRIGDKAKGRAASEQAQVATADAAVLQALAAGNEAYEQRFGFIFIICARGKPPAEILAALQQRLSNDRATEIQLAAAEQEQITAQRLIASIIEEATPCVV